MRLQPEALPDPGDGRNDTITWVNKALDRDPTNLFARELRGGAYFKTGDLERMLEDDLTRAELLEVPEATLAAMKRAHAETGQMSAALTGDVNQ